MPDESHSTSADALDVIAAAMALPVVNEELARLRRGEPMGNNASADAARARLRAERTPLLARRAELLAVLCTPTRPHTGREDTR